MSTPTVKLYNVTRRVVDLVWADSPESAVEGLARPLRAAGFEVMPDGPNDEASVGAFVSEPVPDEGWEGE